MEKKVTFSEKIRRILSDTEKYGSAYLAAVILKNLGFPKKAEISIIKRDYFLRLSASGREEELCEYYLKRTGRKLDFDHCVSFSEKMQWLKLYDSTPLKTRLADKYLVRDWIKEKIGENYLIPLLGVWDSFDEIDFTKLPESFVLKANHAYAMNVIVKDVNSFDWKRTKKKFDQWMHTWFGADEKQQWHYLHIPHKIIAEQYIANDKGELPDYKIYCFNGEPRYIHFIEGRFAETKQMFLDTDWNPMSFTHDGFEQMGSVPEKPAQLDEMIRLSRILSEGFSFVRVDWYLAGSRDIYFGEMTFTPAAGFRRWVPDGTDEMLGALITLPDKKQIVK